MKAYLYREEEQPVLPADEQQQAIADEKPARVEAPKQGMYLVDYKPVKAATCIALLILVVWALATWLLN